MIHFNELRIVENKLIIDVSVLSEDYYKDVYLDSIVIDNQDTYISNGPSSNPVYDYTVPDDDTIITQEPVGKKHIRLVLDKLDGINTTDLLFVYVRTKGAPTSDTPCGWDTKTTLGVVYDECPMYKQAMNYISEIGEDCNIPMGFIDFILGKKALDVSILAGHHTESIKFFNKFFKNRKVKLNKGRRGCGCNR